VRGDNGYGVPAGFEEGHVELCGREVVNRDEPCLIANSLRGARVLEVEIRLREGPAAAASA
jgi:hypothetical protein